MELVCARHIDSRTTSTGAGVGAYREIRMANHKSQNVRRPRASHAVSLNELFSRFAQATAHYTGHPAVFLIAVTIVIIWAVTGPLFNYSDTWQLVINTGTTIVTFLMVFLIQNTQNRDAMAFQLKLSELVLAMKGAENRFASIEDLSDDELLRLHEEFRARAELTRDRLVRRGKKAAALKSRVRSAALKARSPARRSSSQR
jgi:low affinity Fe/Cu permease